MANQSTKQIARLGGEEQVVTLFGNVFNALQNAQPGLNSEDITTLILNSYSGVLNQISPAKYDYILGVFTSAGLGEQIAKAYALLCIDAVKTLNSVAIDQIKLEPVLLTREQVSIDGIQCDGVRIQKCCLTRFDKYRCRIVGFTECPP